MKSALGCMSLLCALSACEQIIEPDLPEHTPRLVLQAFFTPDSTWVAFVGRSAGILESLPSRERSVAEATVELLAGDRVIDELKFFQRERVYVWEKAPLQAEESYSLRVSAPALQRSRLPDAIPRPVPIAIASYHVNTSVRSESTIKGDLSIKLEIQDPPGETNYYQIHLFALFSSRREEGSFWTKDPSIIADNNETAFSVPPPFHGRPFRRSNSRDRAVQQLQCNRAYVSFSPGFRHQRDVLRVSQER